MDGTITQFKDLTSEQRYRLRKMGVDIPKFPPGRPSVKGYSRKADLNCAGCGATYRGLQRPGTKHTYCSNKCRLSAHLGATNPNYKGGPEQCECPQCNHTFTRTRNGTRNHKLQKYCSPKCRLSALKLRRLVCPEQYRITKNARRAMHSFLKNSCTGSRKWASYFNFSPAQLRTHLENKFKPGMTWANHGKEWHVDHIRPISSFKYLTESDPQFSLCWDLHNLQPLWAHENYEKGRSYTAGS